MTFKSFLMFALCILASIYTVIHSGYKYYSHTLPALAQSPFIETPESAEDIPAAEEGVSNPETPPQSTEKPNTTAENSVPVAATGTALGKIITEFISPYSAGTHHSHVYMKNSTGTDINIESLLQSECGFKIEKNSAPQVLIVHTHTTETYITHDSDYYTENDQSRSLEESQNMVAIGNIFEQKLNAAGIGVIHDKTIHDHPSYTGSYSRAANTIISDLAAYPSVKIVIDIHRDALSSGKDKIKPVVDINGTKAAQVMLVMGSQTGGVTGFPNWQENLKLAVKYQEKMEVMYPGLARAMMLNQGKYNQHITTGSILLEVGSDANTLNEAKNAANFAADALVNLLNTMN